ncbi:MAG: serine-rich protein [Chloroflexota bacterium]
MIRVLNNGLHIEEGVLRYAWFRLETPEGEKYRCVAFRELASVPYDVSREADTLGRQWAALRGVYNAGVDYLYSALGIFHPDHVGIVQLYGAAGEGESVESAAALALEGAAAVEAALANFPQSQTRSPDLRWIEWYLEFVTKRARNILALLGHPDPRASKRGLGADGNLPDYATDDLAEEQNEILFRGLAKLRQDFVFQVTAEHIDRKRLSRTLVDVARVASNFASRRRGSVNIGFSLGIPLMAALGQAVSGGQGGTQATAHSTAQGTSHGWGAAHSDSHAVGKSESQTVGGSETHSVGTFSSHTESHATTDSTATSNSRGSGTSWSSGTSTMFGFSGGHTDSTGSSTAVSNGVSNGTTTSNSNTVGASASAGVGVNGDLSAIVAGVGASGNASVGVSGSHTWGNSNSQSESHNVTNSASSGSADSSGWNMGFATTSSHGGSTFSSHTTTKGHSETHGVSDSSGRSEGWATSRMWAHTSGTSESWGTTDTKSEQFGRSYAEGESVGQGTSKMTGQAFTGGFSTGLVPGVNVGRSWQTEDDVADRLTEILRQFEGLVNQAAAEGGFMTDALLLVDTDEGARAGETLVSQAFHGTNVPTPVLTLRVDDPRIKEYALSFTPCNEHDGDLFGGVLWTRYGTLLTAGQLSAYTAPGLVEESTAVVTLAPTPKGLTFYPDMPGDVVLGHQYSPLTRDLTRAQVRLDADRLFHTMFAADTGYGKSVAAMRLAYETTLKWKLRTVVLDFGAGWRSLLNAPGLEGHVDIRQLFPTAARPLRWNPLQIGRNINPETQWRAFADIFGSVARLGVKRQKQELLDALRAVYLQAGVLVDDREVRGDPMWGMVQADEADIAEAPAGTPIGALSVSQRQKVAVYRSSKVDLGTLYRQVEEKLSRVNPRDTMLTGVLEGILYRMNALVQGAAAGQFAAGPDCVPMEDLAKPWGVAIIEGGMFLDDFGKAFLLGWAGWHLYTDMVARRVHEVNTDEPILQIFFEEANKIFAGVDSGGGDDESGGVSLSQRFGDMFRDARKYKARLHVITQAPSLIPQDIISSCNNLVVGFLKNPKDKDIVLSGIARSEKGFVDEPWRRFLADLQIGMFLGRFPYAFQREMQQPFLFRPLAVVAPEPTDEEIAAKLGRIAL